MNGLLCRGSQKIESGPHIATHTEGGTSWNAGSDLPALRLKTLVLLTHWLENRKCAPSRKMGSPALSGFKAAREEHCEFRNDLYCVQMSTSQSILSLREGVASSWRETAADSGGKAPWVCHLLSPFIICCWCSHFQSLYGQAGPAHTRILYVCLIQLKLLFFFVIPSCILFDVVFAAWELLQHFFLYWSVNTQNSWSCGRSFALVSPQKLRQHECGEELQCGLVWSRAHLSGRGSNLTAATPMLQKWHQKGHCSVS